MQTLSKILKLDGGIGMWSTDKGVRIATPGLAIGLAARLYLDLRTTVLDNESRLCSVEYGELADVNSWYIAIDADFNQATAPVVYESAPEVTVSQTDGRTILSFLAPDTHVPSLIAAAASRQEVTLQFELGGYNGDGRLIFLAQFPIILRNRVWVEGGTVPEEVTADPEYLTAVQVRALIAEATRSTTPGPPGEDGKNAYELAVEAGFEGSVLEWLASLKSPPGEDGDDGEDGKNAYELAVEAGFEGTVLEWLAGLKGEPGSGLRIDATGELAELHAYDDAPAGFVFAASTVDPSAHTCTKYYYVKASADHADWCDPPLADVTYQQVADVAALAPVEFAAPTGAAEYMAFSLANYPNAWVAAVTIDTQEGELQLPLGSTTGIRKIVKIDGTMRIYFGAACPAFETGKVYLSQFLGLTGSETPATDPGETGTIYYGVITDAELTSVTQITAAHLAGLTSGSGGAMGKTSFGTVPAGAWPVVVVPEGFAAYKDDGFGGLAAFAENNGATGTGANGTAVNGVGKVYGEFKLNTAELFFYVRPVGQV